MLPVYAQVHQNFKLNGQHYSHETLKEVAYSLVKEGLPFEQAIGDFLLDWLHDKPTLEVKTSGSTGTPKVISLSKEAMVQSALATGKFFKLQPGNSALHCLPTQYIAGKMMLVRAMVLGLELDLVAPASLPVFDYQKPYDFCAMVPLQLDKSLSYLDNIKHLIVGGATVSVDLKERLQTLSTRVYETYGMTETITHIALKKLNKLRKNEAVQLFKTLPGITVEVDERGCLVANVPFISKEAIVTNDMVKIHSKTSFEWLGRFDNVINTGGVKIIPEQVEAKLQQYFSSRILIASQPDSVLGQTVVLIVEGQECLVKQSVFKVLHKYEIPKTVYFVSQFAETGNGKVLRKETFELVIAAS